MNTSNTIFSKISVASNIFRERILRINCLLVSLNYTCMLRFSLTTCPLFREILIETINVLI
ncbi:hypothetical protein QTP88_006024 [Uroleucon formosanum]